MPTLHYHLLFELGQPQPSSQLLQSSLSGRSVVTDEVVERLQGQHSLASYNNRVEKISWRTIKMTSDRIPGATITSSSSMNAGPSGLATKGVFVPYQSKEQDLGWGVVHLYRDSSDSLDERAKSAWVKDSIASERKQKSNADASRLQSDQCSMLCILAVPSYFTPSDLLGFVGEDMRQDISHVRLVRTSRINRYMVLMRFRNTASAARWQKANNGRAFSSTEPETCHVVYIKSIRYDHRNDEAAGQFPDLSSDPFVSTSKKAARASSSGAQTPSTLASLSSKPAPPPTPALVELPTCPVCLERMDETTGLLTILCQHVFHCSCLERWKGSGCPVCRYTLSHESGIANHLEGAKNVDFGAGSAPLNACIECGADSNLWICLICGVVGCGRYDSAHAYTHYKESGHNFAMDLSSQRVWDYAGDGYVHRLMQSVGDGKLLQMPAARHVQGTGSESSTEDDHVPSSKLDGITIEYTHLLTSQLESQRLYFEEKIAQVADKASKASSSAESSQQSAEEAIARLKKLQLAHDELFSVSLPNLEKARGRADQKAAKSKELAQTLAKDLAEERTVSKSLMSRIKHLEEGSSQMRGENDQLKLEIQDLRDQNRDLLFTICGSEKLKEHGEDFQEGTMIIPDAKKKDKRRPKRPA